MQLGMHVTIIHEPFNRPYGMANASLFWFTAVAKGSLANLWLFIPFALLVSQQYPNII